ncbi:helix-turn-helix domain-containing protein [Microbacterium sp. SORGH_AS_0888]|uniref:helix-turn-helix domain-containing protein n=1 Tax=Microbacterium sp. SORGH_AS_0888 TaxID=3041791 RepID=UPI002788D9D5|nr:helix-turn-helix domain-containing protein [Microbacterium sp. SORGH_AS_0888]MDQ1129989.1 AcrR family transcriptional regulator [Microbacterium sp. SORGH_AS_0888]
MEARDADGRFARGDARRGQIIRAALREFGRKGYDATRIADIAAAAGVTDAGVLHHFSSKRELFLAVAEHREAVQYGAVAIPPATFREFLDATLEMVRRSVEDPDLVRFRVMLSAAYRAEGSPVSGRDTFLLSAALDWLRPTIARAIDAGELASWVDPEQLTLEVIALNDGIRNQWAALPDRVDYPRVLAAAYDGLYERARAR